MKVIRGKLVITGNGEEDDLLGILYDDNHVAIFADELNDLWLNRKQITARYFLTDVPLSKDALNDELAKVCVGVSDIKYGMAYSEYTGYLWTDEKFNIGGHNIIDELKNNIGKYLHLEIEVN